MEESQIKIGSAFYLKGQTKERIVKLIRLERDCINYSDDGETWYRYAELYFEPFVLQITFETLDGCTAFQLIPYLDHQLKPTIYRAMRPTYRMVGAVISDEGLYPNGRPVIKREYRLVEHPSRPSKNRIHARYLEVSSA